MKSLLVTGVLIALGVVAIGSSWLIATSGRSGHSTPPTHTGTAPQSFSHVVLIVEENKSEDDIIGNAAAPYINQLAKQYVYATNYSAVAHPSLPNYLALTSGTTAGITSDCNPPGGNCRAVVTNIADRLEQAHKTWRAYAEGMPVPCDARNSGNYAVKHNPFLYYPDVMDNTARCVSHVVPFSLLAGDLASASSLPNVAFVTPNLCNDMHDCSVQTGDRWLANEVPLILGSPAFTQQRALLVIVWDESNDLSNTVPLIAAGSAAKRGHVSADAYDHYSLLRTIEDNWQLDPLTHNDANASAMSDILR